MISDTTYLAAKMVSNTIEDYFINERQRHALSEGVEQLSASVIEALLDSAFWASLKKEEGYSPQISLVFIEPQQIKKRLLFEEPIRLTPAGLVKLSPAVVKPGIHLGLMLKEDNLFIWGIVHEIPPAFLVIEVVEPGLLVVKHKREEFGKFVNIMVLKGDQIQQINQQRVQHAVHNTFIGTMIGLPDLDFDLDQLYPDVMLDLAVAMRSHRRGGLLLMVPLATGPWKRSILYPYGRPIVPPYDALSELIKQDPHKAGTIGWRDKFRLAIDTIAGFTAIDGATVMTLDYELLTFGAKVARAPDSKSVEEIMIVEPTIDHHVELVHPSKVGGTRHLAGAQFVFDQHDACALVASQDGLFTIFVWSESLKKVLAHRIDTLLM